MADPTNKVSANLPGAFYVDADCIDCDLCRVTAPDTFRRDEDAGASYVWKQPTTPEEQKLAELALEDCPAGTIGKDGGE